MSQFDDLVAKYRNLNYGTLQGQNPSSVNSLLDDYNDRKFFTTHSDGMGNRFVRDEFGRLQFSTPEMGLLSDGTGYATYDPYFDYGDPGYAAEFQPNEDFLVDGQTVRPDRGGGRDTGYYSFQGGDVDLGTFDPSSFKLTDLPLIGLLTGLFSGDKTQDEIDAFNEMTASGNYQSNLNAMLNEGNQITNLGPLGISGTVMNTQPDGSGDTFVGNVTPEGFQQGYSQTTPQDVGAVPSAVFGQIQTNAQGDTFYGGPSGNNQGNQQGGNNQPGAGSSATGASMGMGAGGPNYCFDPDTLIQMEDGSEKKIKEVQIGDKTLGGEVTGVVQFKPNDEIHNYKGVIVAGSHFVKEDGKFIPVADSPHSYKIDIIPVVYSLDTTDRRIWINDIEFADFNGDGFAKLFLNNIGADLTGFEQEVLRQVENKLM
tara:strand:+ start:357 stop:1634 length:1278 start_codon:yes stop_codon:yes gene_type:complete